MGAPARSRGPTSSRRAQDGAPFTPGQGCTEEALSAHEHKPSCCSSGFNPIQGRIRNFFFKYQLFKDLYLSI